MDTGNNYQNMSIFNRLLRLAIVFTTFFTVSCLSQQPQPSKTMSKLPTLFLNSCNSPPDVYPGRWTSGTTQTPRFPATSTCIQSFEACSCFHWDWSFDWKYSGEVGWLCIKFIKSAKIDMVMCFPEDKCNRVGMGYARPISMFRCIQ